MSKKLNETGRSMVEMLGVLAVVGVLSVGSIAGFNLAMNKHRANELLYQASQRAFEVSSQIQQGRSDYSIGVFDNPIEYTFDVGVNPSNPNQFIITIDGVSKKVCEQMKNISGGMIISFKPDTCNTDGQTIQLVYNNDLSDTVPLTKQDPVRCSGNAQCGSDEFCDGGLCRPKCPEGSRLALDGCREEGRTEFMDEHDNCPDGTYDAGGDGMCCQPGYFYCEGDAVFCCKELVSVCTNGTWSASGTAYCVDGQWKIKPEFGDCDPSNPNSANPFCS